MKHGAYGEYKFIAKNEAGNTFEKTLVVDEENIQNVIDLNIKEIGDKELVTEVDVNIDYSKIHQSSSRRNQYKIGNSGWTNYTNKFKIDSYTILNKNWQESDNKTVTVYARSIDAANNLVTITKQTVRMDLDMPDKPVITQTAFESYASITEYGIKIRAEVSIEYGSRTDIDKLYSIDNGETWKTYTGPFKCDAIYVLARSVKKKSGLYNQSDKKQLVVTATDSVGTLAYDGNDSTYHELTSPKRIYVNERAQGIRYKIKYAFFSNSISTTVLYASYYNSTGLISKVTVASHKGIYQTVNTLSGKGENTLTIPIGTTYILFSNRIFIRV